MATDRKLSKIHTRILTFVNEHHEVTPKSVGLSLGKGKGTPRDRQVWAYLQLSRLMNRGYLRRTAPGVYRLTRVGTSTVFKAA